VDKGTRVTITGGSSGRGVSGTVFWTGPNKYGEGERLGVRGDDGQTYWVSDDLVEPATAPPPKVDVPRYEKGDRVSFEKGDGRGTGSVFWTGDNKYGPGQRLGVRDDAPEGEDDAVWLDSRLVTRLDDDAPAPAARQRPPSAAGSAPPMPTDGPPEPPLPADDSWDAPAGADELPEGPPLDDPALDQWAASVPDEDAAQGIPADWQPGDGA
jgi:hypothetical protein